MSTTVTGSKHLGGSLQQWQGPGTPGINHVGSYFTGGHAVSLEQAEKALAALRTLYRSRKARDMSMADAMHLDNLIQAMLVRIRRAKGQIIPKKNPSHDEDGDEAIPCPVCRGPLVELGGLGSLVH